MLLAIDIGNSEITLGVFKADNILHRWRITTVVGRTPDEWATLLFSLFEQKGLGLSTVRASVIGSVAPGVTGPLVTGIQLAVNITPTVVGPETPLPIVLDVDEPKTVGADRVVNTLAASALWHCDAIVVDFGTATTFDCVTAEGHFLGGVIAPGIQTAADQLIAKAAKLPAAEMVPPQRAIGKRTEECIRAGVFFGAADAADGIIRRIKAEWPRPEAPRSIATGGLAPVIAPLSQEIMSVEPDLTLIGLRMAANHTGLRW